MTLTRGKFFAAPRQYAFSKISKFLLLSSPSIKSRTVSLAIGTSLGEKENISNSFLLD